MGWSEAETVKKRQTYHKSRLVMFNIAGHLDYYKSVTTMIHLYRYCSYAYKYTTNMVDVLISNNC